MASPHAALPVSIVVFPAFSGGKGFESLPSLPIISNTFGFLKCVNLSLVGLGLNEVSFGLLGFSCVEANFTRI